MNEQRIKLLAEEAGLPTADYYVQAVIGPQDIQKFAQLIVKECVRIARATPCPYEEEDVKQRLGHTWDMASLAAGRGISKHFGLEK